nr:AMP-binding protein [Myxococcaceae bacterium MCy9487]
MSKPQVEQIYPLSPSQQGMLYESLAAAESGIHVEQLVWRMAGPLDEAALERAWQQVVDRHAVLRTCFAWKQQSEPVQVVLPRVSVTLRSHDLRALTPAEQQQRLEAELEADRLRGFKPAKAPLMKLSLFRNRDDEARLVWTFHHLLLDGWCLPLLLQEVLSCYQSYLQGQVPRLGQSRPFRDYVAWLKRQDPEAARTFWAERLRAFTRPTPLGRPAEQGEPGSGYGVVHARLPPSETATLLAKLKQHHLTPSSFFQGLWAVLLSRYSGHTDVVFGTTVSGRPPELEGVESIIGPFINTLPVRLSVEPSRPLWAWLQEGQTQRNDQRAFEYCSAGQVQQWSEVTGALPLYESILVYENYPMEAFQSSASGPGLALADLQSIGARTRYPLTLIILPGSELGLRLVHDQTRLDALSAERVCQGLLALLRAVADGGQERLGALLELIPADLIPSVHAPHEGTRTDARAEGEEPSTPMQLRLARIWTELLGVERVGTRDNFFARGGHSLMAARLVSSVNDAFAVQLPLVCLYESPSFGALAERIASLQRTAPATMVPSGPALPQVKPTPRDRFEPFPLTDIQQAYWVGRSGDYELGQVSTHIYFEINGGALEVPRLEQAWRRLIDRHDMLRAVILPDGRQQVLREVPPYSLRILDLRGQDEASRTRQLEAVREEMSHQVLPADRWPLFEIRASLLDDGHLRLHVGLDALIADAWSMFCLFQEWARLYQEPDTLLPPLELTFRDYVLAEEGLRRTPLYERARAYWMERVERMAPAPELPLARAPNAVGAGRFHRRSSRLPREAWRKLKQTAAEEGLTPSAILCAAFSEVLARWSKSPRFTLNLTLFNRLPLHPQINDLVGDFTSLTLLEVDASLLEPFTARALRLQQQLWQDLDHRHFGGVRVLRELARRQGGTQRALMPVVFTSTLALGASGQEASVLNQFGEMTYAVGQTPQVWLDHQVIEQDGGLLFNWDAVEELFPAGMLDDMFEVYCRFLSRLVEDGSAWHELHPELTPPAHLARRATVNATEAPLDGRLLHEPFLEQVRHRPRDIAVITSSITLTYGELDTLARHLAHQLREAGVQPDTLVAVVMEKGWEQVVAVLGILMSGAAYLPVAAELPLERRRHLLRVGEVRVVVTQPWLEDSGTWPDGLLRLRVDRSPLALPPPAPLPSVQSPHHLAYVLFTSGSTGQPKGVMVDHRGALNTLLDINSRFRLGPSDRVLALSELGFDLSVFDIFGLLAVGGSLVLPDPALARDPSHWEALLRRHSITLWNSVPASMVMLASHLSGRSPPASLRLALLSGDWIPLSLPSQLRSLWPSLLIISLGGATEASIWSIFHPIDSLSPDWKSIPYGTPLTNQRFHVLDELLRPVPDWVPGQLFISGAGLALGYWRDEQRSSSSFFIHPRSGERLYRTGDLGRYWPHGSIEFLGREDFQVKVNGFRIELGEVEAALGLHPSLREAVVTAVGEPQGNRHLVAYVVPKESPSSDVFPMLAADPAHAGNLWRESVEAALTQARQPQREVDRDAFIGLWRSLDELYLAELCGALRKFGVFLAPGESYDVDEIMARCRVASRYRKWLSRGLRALAEEGVLRQHGERFEGIAPLPAEASPELPSRVRAQLGAGLGFSQKESDWFLQGVADLPQVLTDGARSAQVYAAEETPLVYRKLFQRSNEILASVLRAVVATEPHDRPLRILEVGAGYGSTTEHLLPLLPPSRCHYTFTDISSFFLTAARKKFADFPFVEYGLLDLEASPRAQGYEPQSFDVIVASSVLHDTRQLKDSLENLRTLLAPGGLLLVLEETKFFRSFDLIMGLQQGFDRFEDLHLRPHHPLLPSEQWVELLRNAGYEQSTLLSHPGSLADFAGFDVLLAQGPLSTRRFEPAALREYLSQRLPDYMVPSFYLLLDALPRSSTGKIDRKALPALATPKHSAPEDLAGPRTPTEEFLAKLWTGLLGLEQVGIHGNFFELGGDSLLATQLTARVREAYAMELPLRGLYEHPTVATLAEYVDTVSQALRAPASAPGTSSEPREEGEL